MSEKIEVIAELKDLISGKFKEINSQVDRLESSLAGINRSSSGGGGIMGQVLGANLLTGAISRAGSGLIQFGKEAFNAYGKSEQFLVSLTTMFRGNAQEAKALDNQLKSFAIETPFELTEIRDATKMMIAYGSKSGDVVNEMRMLGDISSGVGSSLSEVAYLYGTLRTQGRAFSRDIYQFTGRGIPIVKELAKQFHVTDSAVMKLVEDGKVGFREVEKAMQSLSGEGGQFHNMMAEQSKTLLGQTSNLSDAWNQLQTSIGESQQGILKGTVSFLTEMVGMLRDYSDQSNMISKVSSGLTGKDRVHETQWWNPFSWDSPLNQYRWGAEDKDRDEDNLYRARNSQGIAVDLKSKDMLNKFLEHNEDYYSEGTVGTEQRLLEFQGRWQDEFKRASKDSKGTGLVGFKSNLYSQGLALDKQMQNKEISGALYKNERAIIDELIQQTKGAASLQHADKSKAAAEQPKDLEKVAKQNSPHQIIVNIENLVREYTNEMITPEQAKQMTVTDISKALTAAVNDIYAIGQ